MRTDRISLSKDDFLELIKVAAKANLRLLVFSTNSEQEVFASGGHKGKTKKKVLLQGKSGLLDRVAENYRDRVKKLGGKFKITFRGVWAMGTKRYFIEWDKTKDLHEYERSAAQNTEPKTPIEVLALVARPSL